MLMIRWETFCWEKMLNVSSWEGKGEVGAFSVKGGKYLKMKSNIGFAIPYKNHDIYIVEPTLPHHHFFREVYHGAKRNSCCF